MASLATPSKVESDMALVYTITEAKKQTIWL